jgi:Gpi18-like mannosyltransferase
MDKRKVLIFILILLAALIVRISFIPSPGYERDVQLFKVWSKTAAQHGVVNIYDKTWCDYPPAYLYVLKLTGKIYQRFYPDFKEQTYLFNFLVKFPPIMADLVIALIVFLLFRRNYNFKISTLAMSAYALNPVIILNSACWGQVDSVSILITLLAVLALVKERYLPAWGLITLAILVKTQMFILLPIFILLTWRRGGFKRLLSGLFYSWVSFVAILLPFFIHHKVDKIINLVINAVGEYPYITMNAFNLWWLFSLGKGRWILDTQKIFNLLSFRLFGTFLFVLFMVFLLNYLFNKEKDEQAVFLSCALAFFAFFMLPTEMHERYILPMFVFLLLAFKTYRLYWILSVTAFINLIFVLATNYPKNMPLLTVLPWDLLSVLASLLNCVVFIYLMFSVFKWLRLKHFVFFVVIILLLAVVPKPTSSIYLSDLSPIKAAQDWGKLQKNRSVNKNYLKVHGYHFRKGLGTHANSTIEYFVNKRWKYLEGFCGIDDEENKGNKVEFIIYADGKEVYRTETVKGWGNPRYFIVPIKKVNKLKLVVRDGGDGINFDHADWLNIRLLK